MEKHSKYLEKIVRNQRIVHFSTSNGAHFGPISVENAFPLIQFGNRKAWKCSLVAFVWFEVFYERTWMQKMLHICNQNVVFARANQHFWLKWTVTIEEEEYSTLIGPKCAPFEVEKWTMRWFLTIFLRYFECFSTLVGSNYVYWWHA